MGVAGTVLLFYARCAKVGLDHIGQEVTAALWKKAAASAPPPNVFAPILVLLLRRITEEQHIWVTPARRAALCSGVACSESTAMR